MSQIWRLGIIVRNKQPLRYSLVSVTKKVDMWIEMSAVGIVHTCDANKRIKPKKITLHVTNTARWNRHRH